MELGAEDGTVMDDAGHGDVVFGGGGERLADVFGIVGVDVVHAVALGDVFGELTGAVNGQRVPADMRDLERTTQISFNGADFARNEVESFVKPVFMALIEEHLHAEADAEQRGAGFGAGDDERREARVVELLFGVSERPDARENEFIGAGNDFGVAGDEVFDADMGKRMGEGKSGAFFV